MACERTPVAWFLLRFGVAFTFLYASISAFIDPAPWLSYFPGFLRSVMSDQALLLSWGGSEVVIGLWLLSGWRIFFPSLLAAGFLLGIFIFDFSSLHVTFRNVSILCTSIALAVISNPHYSFHLHHRKTRAEETHLREDGRS